VLVAEDVGQRGAHGRVPLAFHDVQVGTADARTADPDDHVEGTADLRLRYLVNDGRLVEFVQPDCLHWSSSPCPGVSYRTLSMPRQMLPLASRLVRVSCALRRCSGSASVRTAAPVFGSMSRGASSPAGSPSSARRSRSRRSGRESGTSPSVISA